MTRFLRGAWVELVEKRRVLSSRSGNRSSSCGSLERWAWSWLPTGVSSNTPLWSGGHVTIDSERKNRRFHERRIFVFFFYISLFPRIPRKRRGEIDSRKMMIPSSTTPLSSFVSFPGSVCYLFGAYLFVGWIMDSSFGILKKSYKPIHVWFLNGENPAPSSFTILVLQRLTEHGPICPILPNWLHHLERHSSCVIIVLSWHLTNPSFGSGDAAIYFHNQKTQGYRKMPYGTKACWLKEISDIHTCQGIEV